MSLAQRISDQIRKDAADVHRGPRWTAKECELAAEVQRLNAENAGLRVALEAVQKDQDLAKDLQAVRDACANRIDALIDEAEPAQSLKRLSALADAMRGQG